VQPMSMHAWLRWDAVKRLLPVDARTTLEVGAGLGSFAAILSNRFDYVGLEPDEESHRVANERAQGKVKRETAEDHEGTYDLVCAFEVLEHLEDDVEALRAWAEHTRRWLMVSVPMNPDRWGPTDEHAGHFRRYTRDSLASTLGEAGLIPQQLVAYGFPAGYALETARNTIVSRRSSPEAMSDRTAASGRWLQPPRFMGALTWAAALPMRAIQRPFGMGERGTGLVALAQRESLA
jgi:SAM-dependent methyltransferase